jgi:cation diffusion facilitator family transporter
MQVERAERARIVEHHARAVVEGERGTREPRQRLIGATHDPIAGHAKVGVEDASVGEVNELVLTAALHVAHSRAMKRTKPRRRHAPRQRRVECLRPLDRAAGERGAQSANGGLDFRKLGHESNLDVLQVLQVSQGAAGTLTHSYGPRQLARVTSPPQSTAAPRRTAAAAHSPAVRTALIVVLVLNGVVAIAKVIVGVHTGALTVLGAALESGLDMLNNVIGIMLVRVASQAPDEEHPYGHDKFETLGAIGIVGFLSISCFELLREGIGALITSTRPHHVSATDIAVIAATLIVNVFVVTYERRRGRALNSVFLMADASHTASDILVTLMAVAALALASVGWARLDALLSIAVALIIARSGAQILRESIPILVDERAIDAARLRGVVLGVPEIREVRNVRSRSTASGQLFAEVTIAVSGATPVDEAHRLADAVEAAIEREFGTSQVTVHIEPA